MPGIDKVKSGSAAGGERQIQSFFTGGNGGNQEITNRGRLSDCAQQRWMPNGTLFPVKAAEVTEKTTLFPPLPPVKTDSSALFERSVGKRSGIRRPPSPKTKCAGRRRNPRVGIRWPPAGCTGDFLTPDFKSPRTFYGISRKCARPQNTQFLVVRKRIFAEGPVSSDHPKRVDGPKSARRRDPCFCSGAGLLRRPPWFGGREARPANAPRGRPATLSSVLCTSVL